ncbi:MAG: ATP-binding cassette domain-containing protein [Bacteroidales bacterium]
MLPLPESQVLHGNIVFRDITFHYPTRPDTTVLNHINAEIKTDTLVALVGPSGAGKSTFIAVAGSTILYQGQILFDGRDSSEIPVTALRNQMAVVPRIFSFWRNHPRKYCPW